MRWFWLVVLGCGRIDFDPLAARDGGGADGVVMVDADPKQITSNLVFVTSVGVAPAQLGGLAAADLVCNERAVAAGLPGTYVAWLSSVATPIRDRLGAARGWRRMDGLPFADTQSDLLAGRIYHPVLYDELGNPTSSTVLTASGGDGTCCPGASPTTTCSDFTAETGQIATGDPQGTTYKFTFHGSITCNGTNLRLYCFGISRQEAVVPNVVQGRKAFVAQDFIPVTNGGIESLDAECMQTATMAGLAGTYRALAATTTASAASRFDPSGPVWTRIDGIPLAATAAAFLNGELLTTISQAADGTYLPVYPVASSRQVVVLTGLSAGGLDTLTLPEDNCNDWNAATDNDFAHTASFTTTSSEFFARSTQIRCSGSNGTAQLYCLEL